VTKPADSADAEFAAHSQGAKMSRCQGPFLETGMEQFPYANLRGKATKQACHPALMPYNAEPAFKA
jgi:hypothetical protein